MRTPVTPPPPPEPTPVVAHRGRKIRPVTPREVFQIRQWEMDYRFVKEVEYLEREGRIDSRYNLEKTLGLERGAISTIRLGLRGVGLVQVAILFEKFRGDRDYIMFGVHNKELSAPYIPGVGRIDRFEAFYHRYSSPARWRVGPRPETRTPNPDNPNDHNYSAYYPEDPNNEQWSEPARRNINSTKGKATAPDE
jgi:hypothetical protein